MGTGGAFPYANYAQQPQTLYSRRQRDLSLEDFWLTLQSCIKHDDDHFLLCPVSVAKALYYKPVDHMFGIVPFISTTEQGTSPHVCSDNRYLQTAITQIQQQPIGK